MHPTDDGFLPLLRRIAAAEPSRRFARHAGRWLTMGDLDRLSRALAGWLGSRGVGPGDHVALMLRNSELSLALLFAIARAGAIWVPLNVAARGDNLAYILGHSRPRLLVVEDDLLATVLRCGSESGTIPRATATEARAAMATHEAADADALSADADAPYAIMYTSGTTGRPKGVIVSHRMLRIAAEAARITSGAEDGDVMVMWEPLFHIGGAQMIVLPLIRHTTLVMIERFRASRFWHEAKEHGATHIHFLGGILQILLKQPPSEIDRAHGVKIAWGGGAPRDVWDPFMSRFGVSIRECYGMTECSSFTTVNLDGTPGSCGKPLPWFEVEVVDADGRPVGRGQMGEIVVRTSLPGAITRGYLADPEATSKALRGGAFWTGDYGSFDANGNLTFHGRMTDSARVKGENVSAFEVEHVAAQHPAVEDCAMVAVATDIGEDDLKLYVKPRPGVALDPAALSGWLAERLAPYQNPRYIAIIADFERTPSHRIMKHKLARAPEGAWDRLAANVSD
jgi:crotonobetaine/carnitine-CoA ligase